MSTKILNENLKSCGNACADKASDHSQILTVANDAACRLPDSTTLVADQGVIAKLAMVVWLHLVWASTGEKVNTIYKVLAIIDSPWHNLLESMTIATILKAIYDCLFERTRTRKLAKVFKKHAIEWILDDMRTVWKLPVPKEAPAKRPEKKSRNDENTAGAPTTVQLRLHSALFVDMFTVGLVDRNTFLDTLSQIVNSNGAGPRREIIVLDIMRRTGTQGRAKIPLALWRKVTGKGKLDATGKGHTDRIVLGAAQEDVECLVQDAKANKVGCGIEKKEMRGILQDFVNQRCKAIQEQIEELDRDA